MFFFNFNDLKNKQRECLGKEMMKDASLDKLYHQNVIEKITDVFEMDGHALVA